MQVKKLATILVVVVFLLSGGILGCSKDMTPEQRVDASYRAVFMARAQLNDLIRSYKTYKTVLTPEKQLEVAELVVPVLEKADFALDQWQSVLVQGELGYGQQERWLQAKRELTMLLFELGVIKVGE